MGKSKEGAKKVLKRDEILLPLVDKFSLQSLDTTNDVYYRLLRAIVYQQLSLKAAETIFGRFCALFSDLYPYPHELVNTDIDTLRAAGLSNAKANYVTNVAEFFMEHNLFRQDWDKLRNEEVIKILTKIKGVGQWTAQVILLFSLGRKDVFLSKDLSIQQSMKELYQLEASGTVLEREIEQIAEQWRPYRSLACRYLWLWRDNRF